MKLSDYVVSFLESHGIKVIFGYQGSSVAHTIDSISKSSITFIQNFHEQGAAFAACGSAMRSNSPAAALSCSGPGSLNLITGIADAWFDSLPCFFITGQVGTAGIRQSKELRQLGFQETDIVSIVKPITKYAVTVMDPDSIATHLEAAWQAMVSGRPGPVLLDIPHNVQASQISLALPDADSFRKPDEPGPCISDVRLVAQKMRQARRPLLLLGGGAAALRDAMVLSDLCSRYHLPVVCSYLGRDILDNTHPSYIGVIGAYGNRIANYAVKHCDLLLCLGSRIDGRQTGDDLPAFASQADIIQVDLDADELAAKPSRYQKILSSCQKFLEALAPCLCEKDNAWLTFLQKWAAVLCPQSEYPAGMEGVNPNRFCFDLSQAFPGATVVLDVGQNQIWANSSLQLSKDARLIQSGGLGAMGFALPAAIGACCTVPQRRCFCICGDGGFQMNLQELETLSLHNLPICVVVMNNHSLGLIRVYQNKALSGNLVGSVSGFGMPDLSHLAAAYHLPYYRLENNEGCSSLIKTLDGMSGPCLVEVCLSPESQTYPEPTYRQPVDIQSPPLAPSLQKKLEDAFHEIES